MYTQSYAHHAKRQSVEASSSTTVDRTGLSNFERIHQRLGVNDVFDGVFAFCFASVLANLLQNLAFLLQLYNLLLIKQYHEITVYYAKMDCGIFTQKFPSGNEIHFHGRSSNQLC